MKEIDVSRKNEVPVEIHRVAKVLDPKLSQKMAEFGTRLAAQESGFPALKNWHVAIPDGWGQFAEAPFERSVVYQGNAKSWAYSHHQAITKFQDKYVVSWSNGLIHEDSLGQEVHYAWSVDGSNWSEPHIVAHTPADSSTVRNNAGLYAGKDRLYCYVGVAQINLDAVGAPGSPTLTGNVQLDVYETADLKTWTKHESICDNVYLFEGPRMTLGGKLLCCGFDLHDHHARVLIWDDPSAPTGPPRLVDIPVSAEGILAEQGTWYQTNDGRIWMYHRDASARSLALNWSDDEGDTWSDLLRSDFPNSYSRAFAGQLDDGRYYIVGNNCDRFLYRKSLLIALSDDGQLFDRQYVLVQGDTSRRIDGQHKEDGYHYPNCVADGNRLLVVYSVNKEDIEVGILDTSQINCCE